MERWTPEWITAPEREKQAEESRLKLSRFTGGSLLRNSNDFMILILFSLFSGGMPDASQRFDSSLVTDEIKGGFKILSVSAEACFFRVGNNGEF